MTTTPASNVLVPTDDALLRDFVDTIARKVGGAADTASQSVTPNVGRSRPTATYDPLN